MADLMSAGPNGPCPYLGEPSVTVAENRCVSLENPKDGNPLKEGVMADSPPMA